jgi:hypothetical protein
MGYNIREGCVEQHKEHLELIYQAALSNKPIMFKCARLEDMNRMKYQFNKILKATDMLPHECEGRYTGLRQQVRVKEDWETPAVVIQPIHSFRGNSVLTGIAPAEPNEHDAIEKLKLFEGPNTLVKFKPSPQFNLDIWQLKLNTIGFDLMRDVDKPGEWIGSIDEKGHAAYAVTRKVDDRPSGFGLLDYNPSGNIQSEG